MTTTTAKKLVLTGSYEPVIVCNPENEHFPQENFMGSDITFFKSLHNLAYIEMQYNLEI
jgi:hypothetical protein